jgi:hypothetical protein
MTTVNFTASSTASSTANSTASSTANSQWNSTANSFGLARIPDLILSAGAAFCAGMAFAPVFGAHQLWPLAALGAGLPPVITVLSSAGPRRLTAASALVLSAVGFVLAASASAARSVAAAGFLPTPATFRLLGTGLTDGWWRMLTVVAPAPADPAMRVAVLALVWFAAAVSAELVVRSRGVLVQAVAPTLVLVMGLAFSVGAPGSETFATAVFAFCVAVGAAVRSSAGARAWTRLIGVASAVVAVGVAAVVGPLLPFARSPHPFDPRSHIAPSTQALDTASPLDEIPGWLATPDRVLFHATLPAGVTPSTWRLASLTAFDGADWSPSGTLQASGGRIPAPADGSAPAGGPTVTQTVAIDALGGSWMPTLGTPVTVTGLPVDVNLQDASLVAATGLRRGQTYTARSRPGDSTSATRDATPADDPSDLALPPGAPAVLQQTAQDATAGATFPAQQAVKLADYLRTTETFDPTAIPGHTYGHLAYFLSTSHRGSSEQFACAYAVMARQLGLPTRVVVGFSGGVHEPDGTWTVHAGDVLAWPEVDFAGIGWVPFFPTPAPGSPQSAAMKPAEGESTDRAAQDRQIGTAAPIPAAAGTTAKAADAHPAQHTGIPLWLALTLLAAAALLAGLARTTTAPTRRRRRRRRNPDPNHRTIGAWHQALDDLSLLRFRPPPGHPAPAIARAGAEHAQAATGLEMTPLLAPLARLADAAAFAPGGVGPEHAAAAWSHADALAAALRGAVGRRARVARRVVPFQRSSRSTSA